MPSILGNTTLNGCNSIPDFIPTGSRLMWAQANAPTSWIRVGGDTENNRMLRVVSGDGGGIGGTASPILNNVVPSHTHSFTTGDQSRDHSHGGATDGISATHLHSQTRSSGSVRQASTATGVARRTDRETVNTGNASGGHIHAFTTGGTSVNHSHSGSTDNGSSQTNWAPRYIDMILCRKL